MNGNQLDPNDFIDTDAVFDAEYNPDRITLATFTIVPGDQVNHCELVYWDDGVTFLGGPTGTNWAISMYYGYRYNGDDIPIMPDAARHILETLAGSRDLKDYDWAAQNWVYCE